MDFNEEQEPVNYSATCTNSFADDIWAFTLIKQLNHLFKFSSIHSPYVKQIIPSSTFYTADSVPEQQQKIWRDSERQIYKRAWAPLGSCNIYGCSSGKHCRCETTFKNTARKCCLSWESIPADILSSYKMRIYKLSAG